MRMRGSQARNSRRFSAAGVKSANPSRPCSSARAMAHCMLKRASVETGDKARDLRSQVETQLLRAKLKLQEIEGEAVDRAKVAARATDEYVRGNPWQAVGIAAAAGLLVGLLMNRR